METSPAKSPFGPPQPVWGAVRRDDGSEGELQWWFLVGGDKAFPMQHGFTGPPTSLQSLIIKERYAHEYAK